MADRVKVRWLSPAEGQRLQRIVRRGESKTGGNAVRWRAVMLLASAGGNTVPVIARLVAADEDTVGTVIHLFNEIGLGCLDPNWAGGRPAQDLADAQKALKPIPAKLPANELKPDAKLARPHLKRRSMQMVLRLLAFNAEAWLADRLNAYLNDPDEYRAISRHLLHQGGSINYGAHEITVSLEAPDSPRIAGTLTLLTAELNNTPTRLPGDGRSLNYQVAQTQSQQRSNTYFRRSKSQILDTPQIYLHARVS